MNTPKPANNNCGFRPIGEAVDKIVQRIERVRQSSEARDNG